MRPFQRVLPDYDAVLAEVERIAAESTDESINAATLANVHDLIAVCRNRIPIPECLGRGYWPTIWLQWGFVQIEVFDDRLEVYHLKEGETAIWYEEHHPGAVFSHKFLAELYSLGS